MGVSSLPGDILRRGIDNPRTFERGMNLRALLVGQLFVKLDGLPCVFRFSALSKSKLDPFSRATLIIYLEDYSVTPKRTLVNQMPFLR